ncbi:MAG: hypothetical protein ING66_09195 [Rhodocyclaceae bacterium]|nr:hypothetical protein [Rhodocyclaceae bacterium]MCA3025605.1 hypothetical protein [Rhodocyclaceae bacterium]MCA3028761.1 hypothetical protein [Rhodocyclaceae bacterium]MCA3032880.1 hypothetical protein [Rhodocyclaceae bacterium]MCA3037320.1 hypothetical protein [Rhodocyclaceae bacterium]
MRKLTRIVTTVSAALSMVISGLTNAGGPGNIVFDPTNYVENMRQALTSLRQEVLSESQLAAVAENLLTNKRKYEQMLRDARRVEQSLKGMDPREVLKIAKDMAPELAVLSDLYYSVTDARGNLNQLSNIYRQAENRADVLKMSMQDMFAAEMRRKKLSRAADRNFLDSAETVMKSVNVDAKKLTQLRDQIASLPVGDETQSLRKVMELATTQLNVIAGQNTQLITLMANDMYARRAENGANTTVAEMSAQQAYERQLRELARIKQREEEAQAAHRAATRQSR